MTETDWPFIIGMLGMIFGLLNLFTIRPIKENE